MATILAHIKIRAGHEAEFEAIARDLYDGTHQHETRVLRYEYWRGETPGSYYTLLSFDDHRAFIKHQVSDHHEKASPLMRDIFEAIRLEWVDPLRTSSPLPETNAQSAPADADDLTVDYTERYGAKVAEWWLSLRAPAS